MRLGTFPCCSSSATRSTRRTTEKASSTPTSMGSSPIARRRTCPLACWYAAADEGCKRRSQSGPRGRLGLPDLWLSISREYVCVSVRQECHFLFLSGIRWRGSRSCPSQPTRPSFGMDVFPHGLCGCPTPSHTSNGQLFTHQRRASAFGFLVVPGTNGLFYCRCVTLCRKSLLSSPKRQSDSFAL